MAIILISLFIFFLIRKRYEYILYLFIFLNLVIPRNDNFESLIKLSFGFDTRLLFIIFMILILIVKGNGLLTFGKVEIISFIIILGTMTIGVFRGYQNTNSFLNSDIRVFLTFILTYYVLRKWIVVFKMDFFKVIKITIIGGIIYSSATIFIYLFLKGDFLAYLYGEVYAEIWGNRVTFPNNTAQYVLLFFSMYMIFVKENTLLNIFSIMLNVLSILIAQNRTIISVCLLMILVVTIYFLFSKFVNKKITSLFLSQLFFVAPLLILLIVLSSHSSILANSDLGGELLSRFSDEGSGTIDYRSSTNMYAIKEVKSIFWGDGLGKEMLSGGAGLGSYEVSFVDNVFVSVYAKLGLVGFFIIALITIYGLFINLRAYVISKNPLFLIIFIIYPGYLINASYMTSQIIHSAPVYLMYFLLLIFPQEIIYRQKINRRI
ncbi:hypothetical protein P4643_08085 [Priestia megaterium]|uniref:hypothetical protein n=1 Tax=Priestia megaterium TaxID=1404 RepID=UPI000BF9DB68|nr:hypothetical protein [Priestia megaterium]MDH6655957.1 hypothetical protein [Bacillus sp. PvP124]MED3941486.1 hypothetical protein [Priestia megaterium]PFP12677.1 hypothetical protein COJ90_10745 [Priestia megaterium]